MVSWSQTSCVEIFSSMNIEKGFPFVKIVSLTNTLYECIKVLSMWTIIFEDFDELNLQEYILNSC